jgi:hypothetical protein
MNVLNQTRASIGRRAFTLVELVLGMAITTVLLAAMGSLVLIASKAVPDRTGPADQGLSAASALERMQQDLAAALTVVQATSTAIEVTVPDRNGDLVPEDIRYEWGGAGADLLRTVNGGTKVALATSVSQFALTYRVEIVNTPSVSTVANVPEALVASYTGQGGPLSGLTLASYTMGSGSMLGQNFRATLPANARSWTITRVQVCMKADLIATGTTSVQIRTTDASGLPTGTILASAALPESSLSALLYEMAEVSFATAPPLAPNQEVAIVLVCTTGCPSGSAGYTTLMASRPVPMATYSNGSWTSNNLNVMPHYVYATATTSTPVVVSTRRMVQVGVQMRTGGALPTDYHAAINMPNMPGVQ